MKKIFTLLEAALLTTPAEKAQEPIEVIADNASKVTSALTAPYEPGQAVYIKITTSDYLNLKNVNLGPSGNFHIIGMSDAEDGRAHIGFEMVLPRGMDEEGNYISNKEGDKFSIHFENLKIVDYNGAMGNSKHLMNYKDTLEHYIDSVQFVNCEITDICRSLFREETQARHDGTQFGGTMNYFEMSDCQVHYGSMQSNAMPLIYIGQPTTEMVFCNNTFYDLPYLNQLVTFAYMNENTGRTTLNFKFNNNTVCAWPKGTLLGFGNFVQADSQFEINNNVFFGPYWSDECNNPDMTEEDIEAKARRPIAGIQYGVVNINNNLLFNYKPAQAVLDEEGNGDFLVGEELNDIAIENLDLDLTNFSAWEEDLFLIAKQGDNLSAFYTAGVGGAPIGDLNNYTDEVLKFVHVTPIVKGSQSAFVTVDNEAPTYQAGTTITLTANTNGRLNKFLGWSTGETTESITITVPEEDIEIVANFEELPYIAAWNLQQLNKNNQKLAAPLAPNFGDETLTLNYARYNAAAEAYEDVTTDAIETRNNKVSGDLRNCFFISTPAGVFNQEGYHADYAYISIPEAKAGSKLMVSLASDNIPHKNYAIDVTTDAGATWQTVGIFEMTATGKWFDLEVALPDAIDGQATLVRIKGVEADGVFISPEMVDAGTEVTREFLFVSELYLVGNGTQDGIIAVDGTHAALPAQVFNLMGQKVSPATRGLLIKGGKKLIVK
jgi:hypothetical protein